MAAAKIGAKLMSPSPRARRSAVPAFARGLTTSLTWKLIDARGVRRVAHQRDHVLLARDGPAEVDLRADVARIGVVHQELPLRLEHAGVVDPVRRVEGRRVVVEVRRADAGLDRALADAVHQLRVDQVLLQAGAARVERVGRADDLLAEDLRGLDLLVPVALGEAAVAGDEAQAVGVAERAQVREARSMFSGVDGCCSGRPCCSVRRRARRCGRSWPSGTRTCARGVPPAVDGAGGATQFVVGGAGAAGQVISPAPLEMYWLQS